MAAVPNYVFKKVDHISPIHILQKNGEKRQALLHILVLINEPPKELTMEMRNRMSHCLFRYSWPEHLTVCYCVKKMYPHDPHNNEWELQMYA